MSGRKVGIAFALQGAVMCLLVAPSPPTITGAAPAALVAVAVQPLDLSEFRLTDFGDVEPLR